MGLINLLTNPKNFKFYTGGQGYTGNGNRPGLTNIPYGKDQVGGGSSGQPYIQIPIQQKTTNLGLANSDFILRGGTLSTETAAYDALRLTKMFGDTKSPNGILFIAKQQILSRTAVRTQTSDFLNAGVYNPLGTLAQAGIVNIGGHLNKQGNILGETGAYSNNSSLYGVKIKPTQPKDENRLVTLYTDTTTNSTTNNFGFVQGISINPNARIAGNSAPVLMSYGGGPSSTLGIGRTNIRFADQRTGKNNALVDTNPSYFYGTQKKIIEPGDYLKGINNPRLNNGLSGKYVRLTQYGNLITNPYNNLGQLGGGFYYFNVYEPVIEGNTWPKNSPLINNNGTYVYNQADIIGQEPVKNSYITTQDFRAVLRNQLLNQSITTEDATIAGQLTLAPSYDIGNNETIEGRVKLGDPGNRSNKSYASYATGVIDKSTNKSVYPTVAVDSLGFNGTTNNNQIPGINGAAQLGLDKINSLPVYGAQGVDTSGITNDLVKFRIAVIDNNDPSFKTFIHFRALLDSISDSYNATWNPVQYLGRGENFYNYNGFTRQLSLSWTVAAQSKEELIPMYKKLNFLASSLAPDYSPNGYMRGNMVQLTIGGYLYEQPGIITGLTYTMEETSPWEIGIDTSYDSGKGTVQGDSSVKELAHIIKVTGFTFIPIHRFRPEVQNFGDQEDYKRFIALENGENTNYTGGPIPVLPPEVITDIPVAKKTPKDPDLRGTGILIRDPAAFVGPRESYFDKEIKRINKKLGFDFLN